MEIHYVTADTDTIVRECESNDVFKQMRLFATDKVFETNPSPKIVDGDLETAYTEENLFVLVWSQKSVKVHITKKEILPGYFWNGSRIVLSPLFDLISCEKGQSIGEQKAEEQKVNIEEQKPDDIKETVLEKERTTPKQNISENTIEQNALEQSVIEEEIKALMNELQVLQEPKLYTESDLQAHNAKFAQVLASIQEELRVLKEKLDSYSPKEEITVPQTPRKQSISLTPSLSEKLINDLATFDRKKLKHVEEPVGQDKRKLKQEAEPVPTPEKKRQKHSDKKRRRWTNNRIYEDTM